MDKWIPDELMQNIAAENRFSETAFTVKEGRIYHLRWFTPGGEIDFCGHATLGTSYVLLTFYEKEAEEIDFKTQVGILKVQRDGDTFVMNFPAYHCQPVAVTDDMKEAIGAEVNFHSKCKMLGGVAEFFSEAFLCRFPPEDLPRPVVYPVHSLPV